jgi:gas vesicle protein
MSENNNMNGKDFLLGALVGGIIGAAAALLLAPKSGKELRQDIGEGYRVVADKTTEFAGEISTRSQEIAGQVKGIGTDWAGKAKDVGTEWAGKAKEVGVELAGKAKDVTTSVVEDVKSWRESRKAVEEVPAEAE